MRKVKRVRLTMNVPVEARHGMVKGSEHDVIDDLHEKERDGSVWVQGDGERVKLLSREWEPVDAPPAGGQAS